MTYTGHTTTIDRDRDRRGKLIYRWRCETCGQAGRWQRWERRKGRAQDGAAYHEYAHRLMTADEVRVMGDGMYGDLTHAQATERAERFNDRQEEALG